jgi:antitoxin ParD1/3/4
MASETTLNVNLSRDLHRFVRAAVRSGRYSSASELVRDALRAKRDEALREIREKIERALASARRGELLTGNEMMKELKALSHKRRQRRK